MTQLESADELFCPGCGYSLRGIQSTRCPECGLEINWELIAQSIIPWTHRFRIGRVNAFVRTVWFICSNPRGIGHEAARRVNYPDAQRFRWLVVLTAWAPIAITLLIIRAIAGDLAGPELNYLGWGMQMNPLVDVGICLWVGYFIWPVPAIAIFLLLAGITGTPSYFFRPQSLEIVRQNRAVAISFYVCAPLALLFVPCVLLLIAGGIVYQDSFMRKGMFQVWVILQILGYASLIALPGICWVRTLHLLKVALQCNAGRVIGTAVLLPLMWTVLAFLTLVIFPALVGLVKLMIVSRLE